MDELVLGALFGFTILAGTLGSVTPRLGWRAAGAVMVVAALLTAAFGYAIAQAWRWAGKDGPGQGMYFLFMLLPAALVASTIGGLATAWRRRGQGATPARAVLDAGTAIALTLAALFALQR